MKQAVHDEEQENNDLASPLAASAPMIERAFQLLDLLSVSEQGLSLSDLARSLVMSKGSMHRLLRILHQGGVVATHEDNRYIPGPRIYKLAATVRGVGLRRLALPAMQRLAADLGETVFLARLEQEEIHVIESVEAPGEHLFPHVSVPRGTKMPLPAGAVAHLIFAYWSAERRQRWLHTHDLPRFTEQSFIDAAAFMRTIEQTEATGIAIDRGEYIAGVNAVAAPILSSEGTLLAALCVLGFASHFSEDLLVQAGQRLKQEAETIAHLLEPK